MAASAKQIMFLMNYSPAYKCLALLTIFSAFAYAGSKVPPKARAQVDKSANALSLPPDTLIFAQLTAELDIAHCSPGDRVEAEITHEVKVDHAVILERGERVIGQIIKAAAPDASGLYGALIVFDNVATKDGGVVTANLEVKAISPPEAGDESVGPAAPVNPYATEGRNGELTSRSRGAVNLPGVTLAVGNENGKRVTILTSKKGDIRLAKRSQIVFRTANL
jgi:hypothetical protein